MRVCLIILLFVAGKTFGQGVKNLNPTLGHLIDLSPEGEAAFKKDEFIDIGYYDVIGFPFESQKASSELRLDSVDYSAHNAGDLSFKTAWVEGAAGSGIGESLTFGLSKDHPPVTSIVIVNGFVTSKKQWEDHSRVKAFEMSVNGKPFAKLNLADTKQLQQFTFDPKDWTKFKNVPLTIDFKILAVYNRGQDQKTAITEIYINGLSVDK
jgi:hypothetical protein